MEEIINICMGRGYRVSLGSADPLHPGLGCHAIIHTKFGDYMGVDDAPSNIPDFKLALRRAFSYLLQNFEQNVAENNS